jgi:transcription factor SOX7/8/10/18 (SOX group E/F)
MPSKIGKENLSLSNTECSRLLGKMWKEVPTDVKLQYKSKASALKKNSRTAFRFHLSKIPT